MNNVIVVIGAGQIGQAIARRQLSWARGTRWQQRWQITRQPREKPDPQPLTSSFPRLPLLLE